MEAVIQLSRDDRALVGTIYRPPRSRRGWALREALPDGATRFYSLGRWALLDALRAGGVGRGDHVLVPGLICREVLASIHMLGAQPAFYAVSPQLSGTLPADETAARAVIAVNYFGFPQDLGTFRDYCARTGAMLIEDNAHGLFSRDADGRLLGSRGDAGVFSFRKTIAVPDGAALVLTGRRTLPPGEPLAGTVPPARYRLKQAFRPIASVAGPRGTSAVIDCVRELRRSVTGRALAAGGPDAETRIPDPPNPSRAIEDGITVADPAEETRRRRALYEIAAAVADGCAGSPVFPNLPPNVVPYGLPLYVAPEDLNGVGAEVRRHGLQLASWPDLPAAIAATAPDHYRRLMVMPFLW